MKKKLKKRNENFFYMTPTMAATIPIAFYPTGPLLAAVRFCAINTEYSTPPGSVSFLVPSQQYFCEAPFTLVCLIQAPLLLLPSPHNCTPRTRHPLLIHHPIAHCSDMVPILNYCISVLCIISHFHGGCIGHVGVRVVGKVDDQWWEDGVLVGARVSYIGCATPKKKTDVC